MKVTFTFVVSCCIAAVTYAMVNNAPPANAQQDEAPPAASAKQDEKKMELSTFMRQKLTSSNEILEGLVTDDLKKVELGADRLLKMSDAEHWRASNDMMYLNHSRDFRRSVETMRDKAKMKSVDGTALAWIDVTMNCIRCHEWVRGTILVDASLGTEHGERAKGLKTAKLFGGGK